MFPPRNQERERERDQEAREATHRHALVVIIASARTFPIGGLLLLESAKQKTQDRKQIEKWGRSKRRAAAKKRKSKKQGQHNEKDRYLRSTLAASS